MARDLIDTEVRDFSKEQAAPVEEPPQEDMEVFTRTAREMALLREQKARLEEREKSLKAEMMTFLEKYGDPYGDHNQHRAFTFPRSIRGIKRFVRQMKVRTSVDEAAADRIARDRGVYGHIFKPVMVLDQAGVLDAVEKGLLEDADLDLIFPKKIEFAFVVEKEKKRG